MEVSLDQWQLRVLRLMRDATAAGVLRWSCTHGDPDCFETESGSLQSFIRFKWPSYNGDASSDRDFVEVGGAGRFGIGTPGWALALEILGAGLEEWGGHVEALRQQYEWQAEILTAAIDRRWAGPGAAPVEGPGEPPRVRSGQDVVEGRVVRTVRPLAEGDYGPFGELSRRPLPDGLIMVFVPSLASLLSRAETLSGGPLTQEVVVRIRDAAHALVCRPKTVGPRGYEDVDSADPWASWQANRAR